MSLLYILSFISILIQICFVTIAIAAGLYYLAELVEEYTVVAKKVITSLIILTTIIYILFIFFDDLPWTIIISGLVSQLIHCIIMKNFPYVQFISLSFISAVILLIFNHYYAFKYFTTNYHQFSEIMAFFTICLWLVPFSLFVSLSANDNVLPTVNERTSLLTTKSSDNDVVSNYFSRRGKKLGLLQLFNYARESILPQRIKKSF